jgi:hypothetical protein
MYQSQRNMKLQVQVPVTVNQYQSTQLQFQHLHRQNHSNRRFLEHNSSPMTPPLSSSSSSSSSSLLRSIFVHSRCCTGSNSSNNRSSRIVIWSISLPFKLILSLLLLSHGSRKESYTTVIAVAFGSNQHEMLKSGSILQQQYPCTCSQQRLTKKYQLLSLIYHPRRRHFRSNENKLFHHIPTGMHQDIMRIVRGGGGGGGSTPNNLDQNSHPPKEVSMQLSSSSCSSTMEDDSHHDNSIVSTNIERADTSGSLVVAPESELKPKLIASLMNHPIQLYRQNKKTINIAVTTMVIVMFLYQFRSIWMPYLDKTYIQETTLSILNQLQPSDPNNAVSWIRPMILYISGMACWEILGMSTIPVETAAGMVFGFKKGAMASLTGKLLGAGIAFGAGRTFLSQSITQSSMIQKNPIFQLLSSNNNNNISNTTTTDTNISSNSNSIKRKYPLGRSPLQTAFLMKFSCFPECIKNFGSSIIPVIQPWMFLLVTFLHGGTFTLLWTWLGVDTAARLDHAAVSSSVMVEMEANRPLQLALLLAGFVGLVLTPVVMAWWIRDLKQQSSCPPNVIVTTTTSTCGKDANISTTVTTTSATTMTSSIQPLQDSQSTQ